MAAVVKEAGVMCFVAFQRRFDANFMRLKEAVSGGEVGDLRMVHIVSRDPSPPPIAYVKVQYSLNRGNSHLFVYLFSPSGVCLGSVRREYVVQPIKSRVPSCFLCTLISGRPALGLVLGDGHLLPKFFLRQRNVGAERSCVAWKTGSLGSQNFQHF